MRARGPVRWSVALAVGVLALAGLTACDGPEVAGGDVTAAGSGYRLPGVSVEAFSNTSETVVAEVLTDATGRYRFGEQTLPAGTYRLRFNRDEWWGGTDWDSATPVSASAGTPLRVDAQIEFRTATVSGVVREYDGSFDTNAWYAVAIAENVLGGPTVTSEPAIQQPDGSLRYEITGLPVGTYRIRIERRIRQAGGLQAVYSGSLLRSGTPLYDLDPGSTVTAADGVFPEADFALGAVFYDGRGIPVSGALLAVEPTTLEPVAAYVTGQPGQYSTLPSIRVRVYAPAPFRSGDYLGESPTNPLGVALDRETYIEYLVVHLVGQDCDPSVFAERGDHQGEDLSGLNLINCDAFRLNDLRGVDFRGANLARADFAGADLTGADLTGADITEVNWVNATCPDGTYVESASEPGQQDGTCIGHLTPA